MSSIDVLNCRTAELTPEARAAADALIQDVEYDLWRELPETGMRATDEGNKYLQQRDQDQQSRLQGTDFVYFGHTRRLDGYMYSALYDGYSPTAEQAAEAHDQNNDFLWDEIMELRQEHSDISMMLDKFGYNSDYTDGPTFVGSYALPRPHLRNIFGVLFMRGQEYRSWGWGFPWWSEGVSQNDTEQDASCE